MKHCRRCGTMKPAGGFRPRRGTCIECERSAGRAYYAANRAAILARQRRQRYSTAAWRRITYGLLDHDVEGMLRAQGGRCATGHQGSEPLVVDHDHETGRVRGLLCSGCNCGIGLLGDDPAVCRAAAAYLRRARNR